MNSPLTSSKKLLLPLAGAALLLLSVCGAKAQILLTIDDSNPSAVVITATSADSANTASVDSLVGVDLLSFFQNIQGTLGLPDPVYNATTSNLAAANESTGPIFNQFTNDDVTGSAAADLSLFSSTASTFTFTQGSTGFTGTMTIDLADTDFASVLPTVGSTGTLVTGYSLSSRTQIGSWDVVSAPEPSAWSLLLAGVGLLAALRVRSRLTGARREPSDRL